jgi:chromatin assembly factor 1 subunit A
MEVSVESSSRLSPLPPQSYPSSPSASRKRSIQEIDASPHSPESRKASKICDQENQDPSLSHVAASCTLTEQLLKSPSVSPASIEISDQQNGTNTTTPGGSVLVAVPQPSSTAETTSNTQPSTPTKNTNATTPTAKKRKLSPASKEARQQEKEAKERQKLEEKAKKEEEKRIKEEERKKREAEREEERKRKEEKKRLKEEEKAAKEEEKRKKEEEKLKKERVSILPSKDGTFQVTGLVCLLTSD